MNFQSVLDCCSKSMLCIWFAMLAISAGAQDEGQTRIDILQADAILRDQSQPDVQRLIGSVVLGFGDARLSCDSALRFKDGRFRAMSKVQLNDGNRIVWAESMLLDPLQETAIAESDENGDVRLQSDMGEIHATRVDYDLDTKWVRFPLGGSMQESDRTATFNRGLFKVNESMLQLGGDVRIKDGDWTVDSDSLHWDEGNNRLFFYGPSHVIEEAGGLELQCFFGEFDQITESGWFTSEDSSAAQAARVRQDDVWLEADWLEIPADSLQPLMANGRVEIRDTSNVWKVWGAQATRRKVALGDFVVTVDGGPMEQARYLDASSVDTLWLVADTIEIQTDWTRLWPEVHLIQGQAAAECQELLWDASTEQIELIGNPLTWLEGWLLKADSMTWQLADNQPEKLSARGHSGLIFDLDSACMQQISGRDLEAFFAGGELNFVEVKGNAETVYFDSEKPNPCEAYNKSVSSSMRIDFEAGEIRDIVLLQKPEGVWSSVQGEVPQLAGMSWMALPEVIQDAYERDLNDFQKAN
jgi:hypothetical protein